MIESVRDCINAIVSLINNSRAKQQSVTDFGLTYRYDFAPGFNQLTVGVRKDVEGRGRLEFLSQGDIIDEEKPSWKMRFEEEYDVLKYLIYVTYGIQLSEVFDEDIETIENAPFAFYENEKLNEDFREYITSIRKNEKLLRQYNARKTVEEAFQEERENEIELVYDEFFDDALSLPSIEDEVYTGDMVANNVGRIWDNIISFKILDYGFKHYSVPERKIPCYALWIKLQVLSFIETENKKNFYDITIPDFLMFPADAQTNLEKDELKNNLELLYNIDYNAIYSMLQRDFENFHHFKIGISKIEGGINIKDFSEDVLSRLASYLCGQFYTGSKNIYIIDDVKKLEREFNERNFGESFKKNIFAEFLICTTGLKITDLNTVDSFYTMVENIASDYKEENNEEN